MIFDTDVLIWVLRGHAPAGQAVDRCDHRQVSVVTYMELLQGARNKNELREIKSFLTQLQFRMLPLTENVGYRASIYVEEYALGASMTMADALIAATAVEADDSLLTGNDKHFRAVKELNVTRFRP
ncbi:MAG: type II toxin-antitoxin system VapC family toxin [Phycisphaerae bacterium]